MCLPESRFFCEFWDYTRARPINGTHVLKIDFFRCLPVGKRRWFSSKGRNDFVGLSEYDVWNVSSDGDAPMFLPDL
jgi:hypothetical protein